MTSTETTSPAGDTRISTLIGDRLCIRCSYNLVGQPILRERHYDMLIVRCPECGTVASVQEYPLLGRWANRWGAVLAGLWLLLLIALWIGSAGAIFGFAIGSGELAVETYSDMLSKKYSDWHAHQVSVQAANPTPATGGAGASTAALVGPGGSVVVGATPPDFRTWWLQQDRDALYREAGGLLSGFNWMVCYLWMWLMIVSMVLGVMWATLLFARGRAGLLLWGVIIILTATGIGLIPILDWLTGVAFWTRQAAAQQIAPAIMLLSLLWATVWLCMGIVMGRSISRGLIRLMLPPRMRSALAFLWLTDGLEPPTVAQHTPVRGRSVQQAG